MRKHPEQMDNEIYLGNISPCDYGFIDWNTKRQGKTSYAPDGSRLGEHDSALLKPVFINRAEVEAELAAGVTESRRREYQRMLDNGTVFFDETPL
jgi:hypothetical protein